MKKFKKVIAALAATASCALLGMGAYAVDASLQSEYYEDYEFDFSFRNDADEEGRCYTTPAIKEDSLNYAGVHCQGGNVASSMYMYFSVVTAAGKTEVTQPVKATDARGYYKTYYNKPYAYANEYILMGTGGSANYSNIRINGYWNP